jgi:Family of unknown function (DUF5684)
MNPLLPTITSIVLAQANSRPNAGAGEEGGGLLSLIISLAVYVFFSFCWQTIFNKLGQENSWFAWIPILQNYAMFKAGDEPKPLLWTILLIIPLVNIVAIFILIKAFINITKKLGKSPWLLLLLLVPFVQILLFGYLAFG